MTASSPVTSRLLFHLVDVQLQRSTASTNASKLTCVVMFMPGLLSGVIGYLRWSFGIILASIQLLAALHLRLSMVIHHTCWIFISSIWPIQTFPVGPLTVSRWINCCSITWSVLRPAWRRRPINIVLNAVSRSVILSFSNYNHMFRLPLLYELIRSWHSGSSAPSVSLLVLAL